MSSYMPKPGEVVAKWHVIDATDQVLGRLAARISMILTGKTSKVKITGRKAEYKEYDTYSRYPGGRHVYSYERMKAQHPEKIIELAVRRMLPKSKMGRNILAKLKIYKDGEHPHAAQRPEPLKVS
jgi:large subunit ribosomal protein L13